MLNIDETNNISVDFHSLSLHTYIKIKIKPMEAINFIVIKAGKLIQNGLSSTPPHNTITKVSIVSIQDNIADASIDHFIY